jgi:hypothetical protein
MPALRKHQQCYLSSSGHPLAVDGHLPHVVQPLLQHKNVLCTTGSRLPPMRLLLVLVHCAPYVKHPSYVSPEYFTGVQSTQNVLYYSSTRSTLLLHMLYMQECRSRTTSHDSMIQNLNSVANALEKCTRQSPDSNPVNHQYVFVIRNMLAYNTLSVHQYVSTFSDFPDYCPVGLRKNPVICPVKQT